MWKAIHRQLGKQLSNPTGFGGRIVGRLMNISNVKMYELTYAHLDLQSNQQVLEIGFGNGAFIQQVVARIQSGHYVGIDISPTMVKAACSRNLAAIASGKVELHLADAAQLPFPDRTFDRIFSINTLYFWPDPDLVLSEIHRVLKPGGRMALTISPKSSMESASFTKDHFRLYTSEEVQQLLLSNGFDQIASHFLNGQKMTIACLDAQKTR